MHTPIPALARTYRHDWMLVPLATSTAVSAWPAVSQLDQQ